MNINLLLISVRLLCLDNFYYCRYIQLIFLLILTIFHIIIPHLCRTKTNDMKKILLLTLVAAMMFTSLAQETLQLTLGQTIKMAQQQSPSAVAAQHTLQQLAHWESR